MLKLQKNRIRPAAAEGELIIEIWNIEKPIFTMLYALCIQLPRYVCKNPIFVFQSIVSFYIYMHNE